MRTIDARDELLPSRLARLIEVTSALLLRYGALTLMPTPSDVARPKTSPLLTASTLLIALPP